MLTHWGELPVNDAHIHFFSHDFFSALAAQKQGPSPGKSQAAVEAVTGILG